MVDRQLIADNVQTQAQAESARGVFAQQYADHQSAQRGGKAGSNGQREYQKQQAQGHLDTDPGNLYKPLAKPGEPHNHAIANAAHDHVAKTKHPQGNSCDMPNEVKPGSGNGVSKLPENGLTANPHDHTDQPAQALQTPQTPGGGRLGHI